MNFLLHMRDFILNLSLPKKLVLMITPIILVFLVSGIFVYNSACRLLQEKVIESNFKTLEMIKNDILYNLEKLNDISLKAVTDKDVLDYVSFELTDYNNFVIKNRIEKNFADIMITNDFIESFYLIKRDSKYIYYDPMFSNLTQSEINNSVQNILKLNIDIHSDGFSKPFGNRKVNENILHYIRPVYGLKKHEKEGLLIFNINYRYFSKVLEKYKDDNLYYIIDGYGNFIHNINQKVTPKDILGHINFENNSGHFINEEAFGTGLILYSILPRHNWIIAVQVPLNVIYREINFLNYVFIIAGLISIMLSFLLIGVISLGFTSKIRAMIETMKKVENGNLDIKYDVKYKDEIGQLGQVFNNMVASIKNLMHNVSETEIQKREAELNALQSQINPHFLYNTLETIRMVAIVNKDRDVAHMIKVLANLFRYSINRGNEIVILDQEIQHMTNYLEIQKFRYEGKFEVEINIDPDILQYKTIKLILQPIVENAIYHGIEMKPDQGKIIVTGRKCENSIKFTVKDNGIGIAPEELEDLNKELSTPGRKEDKRSIGLKNVSDRIKLHFGSQYGLSIKSIKNEGTTVEIVIPLMKSYEKRDTNVEGFVG